MQTPLPTSRLSKKSTASLCTSLILAGSIAEFLAGGSAQAANGTWLNTGVTNANWNSSDNWGSGTIPGALGTTNDTSVALFNSAIGANNFGSAGTPIVIDPTRNIAGITFDTAAGDYFIGTPLGEPLNLSSGGTIQITSGLTNLVNAVVTETINAPLVVQGANGTYTFTNLSPSGTVAKAAILNFGGGITGGAAGNTVLTLAGSNTNLNTVSGIIADGAATTLSVTKNGTATWVLTGANTYTGKTAIGLVGGSGGLLSVSSINSVATNPGLGTVHSASSNLGAPTTVANGTIQLGLNSASGTLLYTGTGETTDRVISVGSTSGGSTINASGTAGALVFTSDLAAGNSSVGARTLTLTGINANDNEFRGVIADLQGGTSTVTATNLTKSGAGTWILGGNNTYTGLTDVSAGILTLGRADSTIVDGAPVQISGGTLNVANSDTVGAVTVSSGTISGAGTLTGTSYSLTNSGTISAVLAGSSVNLTKSGAGTATLSGANTYSGATSLGTVGSATSGGTFTVSGANGAIATSSGYTISGSGSQLNLDYSGGAGAGATTDRLNDSISAAVTLNNAGELRFTNGTNTTNTSETFGTLTLGQGYGVVTLNQGGTSGAVHTSTAAAFSRGPNFATAVVRGTSLGAQNNTNRTELKLTDASGLTLVGTATSTSGVDTGTVKNLTIVPYLSGASSAAGTSPNFLTYDTASGFRTLGTNEQSVINVAVTNDNVKATGTFTLSLGSKVFNSLSSFGNSGASTVNAGQASDTLTLTSGSLANLGNGNANSDLTIQGFSSIIFGGTAPNGVTVNEAVITTLNTSSGMETFINSAINTATAGGGLTKAGAGTLILTGSNLYTGLTTINQGTLTIGNGASGNLATGSGAITANVGTTLAINLANSATLTSNIINHSTISKTAGVSVNTLSGNISGAGVVTLNIAGGTLVLSGSNTYSGTTTITNGVIRAGSTTGLSANSIVSLANTAGANLDLDGFNNSVSSLTSGGTTGGNVLLGSGTLTIADGNGNTYGGKITGTGGGITKTGAGTQILSSATSDYSGTTTVNAGTLNIAAASSGLTGQTIINNGGNFLITGNNNANGVANSDVTINSGGTLTLRTQSSSNFIRAKSVTMNGGTLLQNQANDVQENVTNALTSASGANVLTQINASAKNNFLTFGSFSRAAGSTLLIRGDGEGGTKTQVIFTAAPSGAQLVNGALIGAFVATSASTDATDVGAYAGGKVNTVSATTQAAGSGFTGNATTNFKFTGAVTQSATASVNSLNLGTNASLNGAQTTNVTSGMILATADSNIGGTTPGILAFGSAEGIVYVSGLTGAGRTLTIGSEITGSSGLTFTGGVNGAGTLALTGANTYTGPTNVNAGILEVSGSIGGASSTAISITGGTLLLSGAGTDRVTNASSVALAGGELAFANGGGLSETVGALTLSVTSSIDFGTTGNGNRLTFASAAAFGGGLTLNVFNWSGSIYGVGQPDSDTDATQDRLLFNSDPAFNAAQISFYSGSDLNSPFLGTGNEISFGGSQFEIVPVPEPSSTALLGAVALLGVVGYRERRRLLGLKRA